MTRKRKNKYFFIAIFVSVLIIGAFVLRTASLFPFFFQLFFNRDINLKQTNSNVNILLLGIGGGVHDGPNLTDTIIFASLNSTADKVTLVTIPRDLWIPDLKAKINSAYSYGESKKKGGGLILSKAVVGKVIGKPIDYAIRIDFSGFVKAVDLVGGLDINVDRTFDDYEYPIDGKENDLCGHKQEEIEQLATASSQLEAFPCRYMHLHFNQGLQHMDGKTALEYVRSRHAQGPEGSDFARSKRQAKIITAFKDRIFSVDTIFNPRKILSLYDVLQSSIDTDIKQDEFDDFIRLAEKMKGGKIQSTVLDTGDSQSNRDGLLISPETSSEYGLQWVVIPRAGNGNFSEIQKYVSCEINTGNCSISKAASN